LFESPNFDNAVQVFDRLILRQAQDDKSGFMRQPPTESANQFVKSTIRQI